MISMEEFVRKISDMRQNANMTQEELALRMSVAPQAASKWERGISLLDISVLPLLENALYYNIDSPLGYAIEQKNYWL